MFSVIVLPSQCDKMRLFLSFVVAIFYFCKKMRERFSCGRWNAHIPFSPVDEAKQYLSIDNQLIHISKPFFFFCLFVFSFCWPSDIVVSGVYSLTVCVCLSVCLPSSPSYPSARSMNKSGAHDTRKRRLSHACRRVEPSSSSPLNPICVCVCFPPRPLLKQECTFVSSFALTSMRARV